MKAAPVCRFKLGACVQELKDMGFSFETASKAARISTGDVAMAIELMMSGVQPPLQSKINSPRWSKDLTYLTCNQIIAAFCMRNMAGAHLLSCAVHSHPSFTLLTGDISLNTVQD